VRVNYINLIQAAGLSTGNQMKFETKRRSIIWFPRLPFQTLLAIATLFTMASQTAIASGYQFGSQTVSGQGNADSGSAQADDASIVFYNPAGMTRLKETQLTLGATTVIPHSTYIDFGSTRFTGTSTGGTATSGYAPKSVTAPSIYLTTPVNNKLTFGLGVFVPYGAQLNYGNTWTGRYGLTDIKLQSLNINPSLAFKHNEQHSFGVGLSAQYMKAKLRQAVDVPGAIEALAGTPMAAALAQEIAAMGGNPAALGNVRDGGGQLAGHHWGYGFNLGYMFQFSDSTRFGLAYRSAVRQKLHGKASWDFSGITEDATTNAVLASMTGRANSATTLEMNTPETVSTNVFSQLNAHWGAMADMTWTRNSRLRDLNIQFPGTLGGNEVIHQNWKDTFRVSVGANYRYSPALLLRSGIAIDQSPLRSPQLTHPAFPDSKRVWYSLGLNYRFDQNSSIDAAYSYVSFQEAPVNYTNDCTPLSNNCTGNGETTYGKYRTYLQFIGVAYNYKF
jgi:long-chain fatty acid transport protein